MADKYRRLREAVLAYAAALKRYASFGSAWIEETPELDKLWNDVLEAAQPEPGRGVAKGRNRAITARSERQALTEETR